jgi:hypothetical protein
MNSSRLAICTSATTLGKILPLWALLAFTLLNQFHPNQAVSKHGLLKVFQGFNSGLM